MPTHTLNGVPRSANQRNPDWSPSSEPVHYEIALMWQPGVLVQIDSVDSLPETIMVSRA